MEKILKWILLLIIVFIAVGFSTDLITKSFYKESKNYEILTNNPSIEVSEYKKAHSDGYVKGTVKNTTGEIIDEATVQVAIYNKNNDFLGYEYYTISYFHPQEKSSFEIHYSYKNVGRITLEVVEGKPEALKDGIVNNIDDEVFAYYQLAGLLGIFPALAVIAIP